MNPHVNDPCEQSSMAVKGITLELNPLWDLSHVHTSHIIKNV